MRLLLLAALALIPILACGESPEDRFDAHSAPGLLAAGTLAPDVTLHDLDGRPFQLSSLRGKTVLLNFWFRH
jgi:cytochrome oxidase Cu insertion factor (SCO1/SenC/PrrC family)